MTATHEALARPASLGNAATAIFALLGLIDVALTAVIGSPDAPPLIVSLGVAALGLITLLSLVPARRGNRGALTAVVVTRVISAVLAASAPMPPALAEPGHYLWRRIAGRHPSGALPGLADRPVLPAARPSG